MKKEEMMPPENIYMQWADDHGETLGEITWCTDKIYKNDIPYKRTGDPGDEIKEEKK